jgi:type 1 glutamine amidotransferase/sugar phosphate isomerase/epimerase
MRRIVTFVSTAAAVAVISSLHVRGEAQAPAQAPPAPAGTQKPAFERAPDALERVTWRTRTLVGDDRLTNWNLAIPANDPGRGSFLDTVVRADAAIVDFVEATNTQTVSRDLQKPFDPSLTADEIATIRARMGTVRLLTYRVDRLDAAAPARRRLFEFAKAMGVDTIVVPSNTTLAGLDALAEEFAITVAVMGDAARPVRTMAALAGKPKRLGIGVDTGMWAQEGVAPQEALAVVKDRLVYVNLRDRSARGTARNVLLGQGVGRLTEFFNELNRLNVRPVAMTLDTGGVVNRPEDLFKAVDAFEAVVQPAYGVNFTAFSKTRPMRWDLVTPGRGESLAPEVVKTRSDDVRQKIDAAIPKEAYARPKKARKLLVIESLQGMSHNTIPHTNLMLKRMGEITGAWTTEFSNDLDNLKYPKVKDYDGVFLNSIVGEFAAEPAVRDGLVRFVREGGGMGGIHGTPWASRNWDEFAEMIGSQSAPHRIEQGVMKVYDPASPLMKAFDGKDLNFREEYYRFEMEGQGRLRWDKVRVVMTVDLDEKVEPRVDKPWTGYTRPDKIYPVSWVRNYGKGRVFYSSLGHMPETFMSPPLVGHFLAGVQYLLGDLDADATPNPRPATQQAPTGAGAGQGAGEGQGRGQGGRGAAPQAPAVPSISQRPAGSSLGAIRVGAADNNQWFGWRVAMPAAAIKGLTFSDALAKSDLLSVTSVEVSAAQIVSPEIPKKFDARLQTGERNAINYRLRELNQQILAYTPDALAADETARRSVFELAKALNIPTIIVGADTSSLAGLDKLAEEFGVNVAIESKTDPKAALAALEGRSRRIGIAADLGGWLQAGIKPVDGLAAVKDRLLIVKAGDRSALGAKGRAVALGDGAGGLGDFFLAAYKGGITPLSIVVESSGTTEADMLKNLNGFERVMWPAMAARVNQMLETPAGKIRGPDLLAADMRQKIDAATPRQAIVKPAKPRKLLVTDIQMYSGHSTIPHGNRLIEQMAKYTGAFEPTFSNDLSLLKYPKIKEFDAIYFNNVCGMVHNDPEVREGILRFVREGGGIGGHHAVTFANNNWPEFAEMMGGWAGAHHTEKQVIKIDDPNSPLTKSFGSASFEHTDEFYQFPPSSPYSREKQHILLSIDVEKSDRATANRFCAQCTRPDQDYGLAWIRTYGKGRTYFTPLGHTEIFYTDQRWTQHLLAAIQYILGDLDADATPSAKLPGRKGSH